MTFLFGAAYYPEHRAPEKWDFDTEQMELANVTCLRVGEFAWSRFETRDGEYDFSWMDTFIETAAARNIRLLMCPPLRTIPAWLQQQDETLRIERADGIRLEYGSRYSFCINHPLLLAKGCALAEAMAEHWGEHPMIAGWHLDNEHGDEPDCHCPICCSKFQSWCREHYCDLTDLNDKWGLAFWGLQFSEWEQIPTPRVSKTFHSPGHLQAWRRFRSDCTVEALAAQVDAIRPHIRSNHLVTTNHQPTWNQRTDYYQMGEHLTISGSNYYPPFGDDSRSISFGMTACRSYRGQNFHVHELRNSAHMIPGCTENTPAPGEVERLTLHCIANGADGIFYFRWRACPYGCEQSHGTITDFDGRPRRVYPEVQRIGDKLKKLGPQILETSIESEVGILYDFAARWASENGVKWNGPASLYMDHVQKIHHAIRGLGYNCDAVSPDADLDSYKVLVVPMLPVVTDELAERLIRFVDGGGTLIWHPLSGIKDEYCRIHMDRLHPRLKELLNVGIQEYVTLGESESCMFTWNGASYAARLFADLPSLRGQRVLGEYTENWYAETPAVWEHKYGEGNIIYVGNFAEKQFYEDLLTQVLPGSGVEKCLNTEVPPALELCVRSNQETKLTFVLNHTGERQTLELPQASYDIYNEEALSGTVTIAPYAVRILKSPR